MSEEPTIDELCHHCAVSLGRWRGELAEPLSQYEADRGIWSRSSRVLRALRPGK